MLVKLDGFLKPFRRKGGDFGLFWSKFLVLCQVNKWSDDKTKMAYLPLLLDKKALSCV